MDENRGMLYIMKKENGIKKRAITIILSVLLLAPVLAACSGQKEDTEPKTAASYADYIDTGARIAVEAGDVFGEVAIDIFKAKEALEYKNATDMLEALRLGKVDAALLNHSYIRQLQDSGMYPDFEYLWVPEEVYVNKAAPIFHTTELRDLYNEWFAGLAADGTWDEILNRWIGVPLPAQEDIPQFELTGDKGVLKMCDTGTYPPYTYFDADGELTGFNIDMMSRFAQFMDMGLEIAVLAYEAIGPYVVSGKADMSACTLGLTTERAEGMIFGEPSIIAQAVLVVPKGEKTELALKTIATSTVREGDNLDYSDFIGWFKTLKV